MNKFHAIPKWFSIPENRAKIYRPIVTVLRIVLSVILVFIGGCVLSIADTLRQSKLGNGFAIVFYAIGGTMVAWGIYKMLPRGVEVPYIKNFRGI